MIRARAVLVGIAMGMILSCDADEIRLETIALSALRIKGQPALAHTQGLEIISTNFYVTARRDDVEPRRALLLRTSAKRSHWDVWDITPSNEGVGARLDHPGGMQSDGKRLWIPLAESKRTGKSLIRAFPIGAIIPGQSLKAEFEFWVNDHIGALAVFAHRKTLFGASWDTETIYVWDFEGRLQRTITGTGLIEWGIGVINRPEGRAGIAVQDWKAVGNWLFASGLFKGPSKQDSTKSRFISLIPFADAPLKPVSIPLPQIEGTELAREAMAIADGIAYFLPEDLGQTNRLFRFPGAQPR